MSTAPTRPTPSVAERLLTASAGLLVVSVAFSPALSEIASSFLLIGFLLEALRTRRWLVPRALLWLVLLWVAVCSASTVLSSDPGSSLRTLTYKTLQYALVCLAAARVGSRPLAGERLVALLAWSGVAIGLNGLAQGWLGHDLLRWFVPAGSRLKGSFNTPNGFAFYLMMVILVQLPRVIRRPTTWRSCALGLGVALEMWALARTDSRAAWMGLFVGIAALLVLTRRPVLMGFAVLLAAVLWSLRGLPSFALWHLDPGRAEAWRVAGMMFRDHPLTGIGLGRFMAHYQQYVPAPVGDWPRPQYAHNCYLQILAESGILGLAAFTLLIGWIVWRMLRGLRDAPEPSRVGLEGVAAATAAALLNVCFDTGLYSLQLATLFWFLLGLGVGMSVRPPEPASTPR